MNNKLIVSVLGVVVGVILIATLLVPVVQDAQSKTGDAVTYSNMDLYPRSIYARAIQPGDVVTLSPGSIDINGDLIYTPSGDYPTYQGLVLSDKFGVRSGNNSTMVSFLTSGYTLSYGYPVVITCSSIGNVKVMSGNNLFYEGSYEFCYIPCIESEAIGLLSVGAGYSDAKGMYVLSDSPIYMSGMYTTADNDTGYWYYDGEFHISQDYTCSMDLRKTLVSGTTDVYNIRPLASVGDENFAPYYYIVPLEVEGHKTSGASYDLLGIIPLIVIMGLMAGVISSVLRSRND